MKVRSGGKGRDLRSHAAHEISEILEPVLEPLAFPKGSKSNFRDFRAPKEPVGRILEARQKSWSRNEVAIKGRAVILRDIQPANTRRAQGLKIPSSTNQ